MEAGRGHDQNRKQRLKRHSGDDIKNLLLEVSRLGSAQAGTAGSNSRPVLGLTAMFPCTKSLQAYLRYMEGTLYFEQRKWEACASALGEVKKTYLSIMPLVGSEDERALYAQVSAMDMRD